MSAYLVEPKVIAAIAEYSRRYADREGGQVAKTLVAENVKSLRCRYAMTTAAVFKEFANTTATAYHEAVFQEIMTLKKVTELNAADVFTACSELDYQSCETDGYRDSKAARYIAEVAFYAACRLIR